MYQTLTELKSALMNKELSQGRAIGFTKTMIVVIRYGKRKEVRLTRKNIKKLLQDAD